MKPNTLQSQARNHAPLINLSASAEATLTARAPLEWLRSNSVWGASMLVTASTRELLSRGGLDIAVRVRDFHPTAPAYRTLLDEVASGDEVARVRQIRTLLYLGFAADAKREISQLAAEARSEDARAWSVYLAALVSSLYDAARVPLRKLQGVRDRATGSFRFHCSILLTSLTRRFSGNLVAASEHLHDAQQVAQTSEAIANDPFLRTLAAARCGRHAAEIYEQGGAYDEADATVGKVLRMLVQIPGLSEEQRFLAEEMQRRTLAFSLLRFGSRKPNDASTHRAEIAALLSLDPQCPHASLLAGEALLRLEDSEGARVQFERILQTGIIERPHALRRLAELEKNASLRQTLNAQVVRFGLPFGVGATSPLTAPLTVHVLDDYLNHARVSQPSKTAPRTLLSYQRTQPYWELTGAPPGTESPRHALSPLLAWESYKLERLPYFEAIALQRNMVGLFREELAADLYGSHALLRDARDGGTARQSITLEAMGNRGADGQSFVKDVKAATSLPPLHRARLARVLVALGFLPEARRVAPLPAVAPRWSPEEQYLASTHAFVVHVSDPADHRGYLRLLRRIVSQMPPAPHNLRTRLILAMYGVVFASKRNMLDAIPEWNEETRAALALVRSASLFSEFEHNMLVSRTYRCTSFLPFFRENKRQLKREIDLCEHYARIAKPTQAFETELYVDNLYACLESVARAARFLGEHERVTACYEELTRIDPFDSHGWVQRADDASKRGDLESALKYFMHASTLAPPHVEVAWFRAGRCAEQLGDPALAKRCYLNSLRADVGGSAAYLRLLDLSEDDSLLHGWCKDVLTTFESYGALTPKQAALFAELSSRHGSLESVA